MSGDRQGGSPSPPVKEKARTGAGSPSDEPPGSVAANKTLAWYFSGGGEEHSAKISGARERASSRRNLPWMTADKVHSGGPLFRGNQGHGSPERLSGW